jgi:hypothetical protein
MAYLCALRVCYVCCSNIIDVINMCCNDTKYHKHVGYARAEGCVGRVQNHERGCEVVSERSLVWCGGVGEGCVGL